jgi:hypothetical protein
MTYVRNSLERSSKNVKYPNWSNQSHSTIVVEMLEYLWVFGTNCAWTSLIGLVGPRAND